MSWLLILLGPTKALAMTRIAAPFSYAQPVHFPWTAVHFGQVARFAGVERQLND